MAKTKISEYDAAAGNNTDIDSINIAEGCAPSNINNAIRELMAHLKDFQSGTSGDSFTVGGNLSVSGTVTIPDNAISGDKVEGGTINAITITTLTAGDLNVTTLTAGDLDVTGDLRLGDYNSLRLGDSDDFNLVHAVGQNYISLSSGDLYVRDGATTRFSFERTTGNFTATGDITANEDLKFNSGYGSAATAYGCRAWVNFDGTNTVSIRDSGNVSSITDNGTGDYTVNFTTAMPDTNYAVTAAAGIFLATGNRIVNPYGYSTSSIRISVKNDANAVSDCYFGNIAVFR